jgi:NAD(P)H dehydrogenase (quinone)
MRHHANAIEAATATNIRDITFTSIVDTEELSPFCFSPVYRDAERQLAAVCLRPSSDVAYIATLFSNIGLS